MMNNDIIDKLGITLNAMQELRLTQCYIQGRMLS